MISISLLVNLNGRIVGARGERHILSKVRSVAPCFLQVFFIATEIALILNCRYVARWERELGKMGNIEQGKSFF